MTRAKGDSDPWLTDPISRDRVIAKTVVEGMRTIISLLRAIRDEQGETQALRQEVREARQEIRDLWQHIARPPEYSQPTLTRRSFDFNHCATPGCSLPEGHEGNHRGSVRSS